MRFSIVIKEKGYVSYGPVCFLDCMLNYKQLLFCGLPSSLMLV